MLIFIVMVIVFCFKTQSPQSQGCRYDFKVPVICNKRVGGNELPGSFFGFIFLLFTIKVSWGQAHSSQARFLLGIGERRILHLLHRILWLTFASLFFYSDIEPLSQYSPVSMLHLPPATRILNKNPGQGKSSAFNP